MQKTILVTGGAGYIGSACVAALVQAGYQVTVFDNLSTGQRDKVHADARFIEGDITDQEAVRAACGSTPFDTVMHFAAKKAVGESEVNPALYFATNVVGSLNLLAAVSECKIPQLIFSSTATVYDSPQANEVLTEATPCHPKNVYGKTKAMVEDAIMEYHRTGLLPRYTIFRYFNVAGDVGLHYTEHGSPNIFPVLKRVVTEDTPMHIFGTDYDTHDGTCVRDYVHLADIVEAHLRAVAFAGSDIFNLGTGIGYTVRELITMFEQISGKPITTIESPRRPGDPARLITNPEKAKRVLGWSPQQNLEAMVHSTLGRYIE